MPILRRPVATGMSLNERAVNRTGATWYCTRQRAGPLVKESRALRPRFKAEDTDTDRKEKRKLRREQNGTFERKQVDKLELRLALFDRDGWMHTLTFDNEHLPQHFREVRGALKAFFKRVSRWRIHLGKAPSIDYIYAIEGLHGKHRWHIHFVTANDELSPAEVQFLWKQGMVDSEPVLLDSGGYRRLAEYLNKERTDGLLIPIGRHPWSTSKTLRSKLPLPEKWKDESGVIDIPKDAVWARRGSVENDFGAYYYASWIEPRARQIRIARTRA